MGTGITAPGDGITATEGETEGEDADDTMGGTGPKLDSGNNGGPLGAVGYIWIANSAEGTVSKINTETLEEEGRYLTREDGAGDPSRTSVSLTGNVAVANRAGGVVKIYGALDDCQDLDGNGTIDTSTGPEDVKAWPDECVAWYTPMEYQSQRAIAWTGGDNNPEGGVTNEKIWVSGDNPGDAPVVDIMLMNGDDGTVEDLVTVNLSEQGPMGFPYRAYGGAVDAEGNFWFSSLGHPANIIRVSRTDFTDRQWLKPDWSYGITVDRKGRVWTCEVNVARFDPATETWEARYHTEVGLADLTEFEPGGCMVDANDIIWVPARIGEEAYGIAGVNADTLEGVALYELPGHVHGVSIDFDGLVWGVSGVWGGGSQGTDAYRVNPSTGDFETFTGLNGAYTYSDMTGFALNAATNPVG
ncbi:MAG: hypothetical protein AAF799_44950 [Myxococcota bacterium]